MDPATAAAVYVDPEMDDATRSTILALLAEDRRAQEPPRLRFNPSVHGSFDNFLAEFRPTRTSARDVSWIVVSTPNRAPRAEIPGCVEACIAIRDGGGTAGKRRAAILAKASEHYQTVGKWFIFASEEDITRIWAIVAKATVAGELGFSAKVSTRSDPPREQWLICVYVEDFNDKREVARVKRQLDKLRVKTKWFKPDIFTHLDISADRAYGIRPSIYDAADVDRWEAEWAVDEAKERATKAPSAESTNDDGKDRKRQADSDEPKNDDEIGAQSSPRKMKDRRHLFVLG